MYEVIQDEPSEEFKRAWTAAGRHLQKLGGEGLSWLRATLNPPMAEHLSFRLGNQLVFVFVEAAEFDYQRGKSLFLKVAGEARAIPCVMPIWERLGKCEPILPGWGLRHALTGEPVDPGVLVSDELIEMTDWELHDFAIQVVKDKLSQDNKNVFSAQSSREIDPSIWFEEGGDAYWVVVREARHPLKEAELPRNMSDIAAECSRMGKGGYFAGVVVANGDDPFDPDSTENGNYLPLYRGHGMVVKYEGLRAIDSYPEDYPNNADAILPSGTERERQAIRYAITNRIQLLEIRLNRLEKKGRAFSNPASGLFRDFSWKENTGELALQILMLPTAVILIALIVLSVPFAYVLHQFQLAREKSYLKRKIKQLTNVLCNAPGYVGQKTLSDLWRKYGLEVDEFTLEERTSLLSKWVEILYGVEVLSTENPEAKIREVMKKHAEANRPYYEGDKDSPHFYFVPPFEVVLDELSEKLPKYDGTPG